MNIATQQYLQRDTAQQVRWVRSQPERCEPEKKDDDLDECGIYNADCYVSTKKPSQYLLGKSHVISAERIV